ncbi:MAG: CAAX amino terminal protease self- immunity [Methanomassiliicoccales archaeon PtaU1.Bin030]|nr:MAG: CAAX amino terminal protease self- immunity [Methanomassiliicoccales archaeon PtaU1.Bin030]
MYPQYPPYRPVRDNTIRDLGMGIGTYATIALLFLMAVNVLIALWGIGQVYPHMDKHIYLFIITPYIINFAELGGWPFFIYYILLVAAIGASLVWAVAKSLRPLVSELKVEYPKQGHSPLYIIGTVLMAIIAFNVIYYLIVGVAGINPSTPSFSTRELWQTLFGFAHASVWEEVASRVLLIGVPLLLIDLVRRTRNPDLQMRRVSNYLLGGGFAIGKKEALLMVFSGLMFGAAHVFSWDLYKVLPAAVAGLAFAYLFLRLGVYASILMHFGIDFMSVPLSVFPDNYAVTMLLGLAILVWVGVGLLYALLYTSKGLGWLMGRRIWPDIPWERARPTAPVPQNYPPYCPQGYGYAHPPAPVPAPPQVPRDPTAFGYVCRKCGHREATYVDGELACLRCGNKG